MATITATIKRIIQKYDRTIYLATDCGTVFGPPGDNGLAVGRRLDFVGDWKDHPRYGQQFRFDYFTATRPTNRNAVCRYLCRKCPGIGPTTASRLFDQYGDSIFDHLQQDPAGVAANIPRLNVATARLAAEILHEDDQDRRLKIRLHGLLDGQGFPRSIVTAAIEVWGDRAADFIEHDPHRLLRFHGIGFAKCDAFYLSLRKNPARLKRQSLAGWYQMRSDREGHTWFASAFFADAVSQFIAGNVAQPDRALRLLVRAGKIVTRTDQQGRTWIAEAIAARQERQVAENIHRISRNGCRGILRTEIARNE